MSPCLQNGWLASACCIDAPFFLEVFLRRSPLTCRGEQLTLETLNIHVRARPAISGGGMEFPRESFRCRAENCILVSFCHAWGLLWPQVGICLLSWKWIWIGRRKGLCKVLVS